MGDEAPILLDPDPSIERQRNWEGLAQLADEGFLIVTDQYPCDLLGYVSRAESDVPKPRSK